MTETKCFVVTLNDQYVQLTDTCSSYPELVKELARATFWSDEKIVKSFVKLYDNVPGWQGMQTHIATIRLEEV